MYLNLHEQKLCWAIRYVIIRRCQGDNWELWTWTRTKLISPRSGPQLTFFKRRTCTASDPSKADRITTIKQTSRREVIWFYLKSVVHATWAQPQLIDTTLSPSGIPSTRIGYADALVDANPKTPVLPLPMLYTRPSSSIAIV